MNKEMREKGEHLQGKNEEAPSGVKLEVTMLVDRDMWAILRNQGFSEEALGEAVKKSITFKDIVGGIVPKVPLSEIYSVDLIKYY